MVCGKRSGLSALLFGIRFAFGNPLTRLFLKVLVREVEDGGRRYPIIYRALEVYSLALVIQAVLLLGLLRGLSGFDEVFHVYV